MAEEESQGDKRLEEYLEADEKYNVVPVPTPLDKETVAKFVRNHVDDKQTGPRMEKLVRLATFCDLRDCVKVFEDVLAKKEHEPDDYARSAAALCAIAWIGNDQEQGDAKTYFHALLGRTKVRPHLRQMAGVCFAFGPKEGTAKLNQWIQSEVDKLEAAWQEHEQNGREQEAEDARRALVALRSNRDSMIARLERANGIRGEIEEMPKPSMRIPKLAKYYIDTSKESTSELSYWSAMKLIRIAEQDAALQPSIAKHFMGMAQTFAKSSQPDEQYKFDLYRARCLRAVEFFDEELDEENREWLDKQDDGGTAALALRPEWKYQGPD
ncbi:MAG: hypothetical protein JSU63_12445 [Phycisphaerales bacterium]|nr:MAG: hypothetical protein JSU63_12445 [Phycisphaerales bacterium]